MAEGRMLKRNISVSKRLPLLKTDSARMLWTWIIPFLDVEGRFYASPDLIKSNVVPRVKTFNEENIADYLQDMASVGLIILYDVENEQYLQFRKFEDHQIHLRKDREAPSRIPAMPPKTTRKPLQKEIWGKLWDDFNKSDHVCRVCGRSGEVRKGGTDFVIEGYIPFEVDHIIPLAAGGSDEIDNLHIICRTCNRSKGDTPDLLRTCSGPAPP